MTLSKVSGCICGVHPLFTNEDVFAAHKHAWKEYGILHCDISAENILILYIVRDETVVQSVGLLCDWDLARRRVDIIYPAITPQARAVRRILRPSVPLEYGAEMFHPIGNVAVHVCCFAVVSS